MTALEDVEGSEDPHSDPFLKVRADLEKYLQRSLHSSAIMVGSIEPFGDGHSGFVFLVNLENCGDQRLAVLRLSPPNARLVGPADIGRQGRIMAALSDAGLPVPSVIAFDGRPVVDGRSFVLMEMVEGVAWDVAKQETSDHVVARRAVEFLHRLRDVELRSTGIGTEAPILLLDELERWASLFARGPQWLGRSADALRDRLAARLPMLSGIGLVHGDFHYGNLIFRGGDLAAVIDWEIAELGDPLLDFGSLAVASIRRRYEPEPNSTGSIEISIEDLLELYQGPNETALWYAALSCFKYAAILGYNYELHRRGKRHDPIYDDLLGTMRGLSQDGMQILEGSLPI